MLSRQVSLSPPKIFKAYRQESSEFQEAVSLWENYETDTISYTDEKGQLVHCPGTIGGGQFAGKPAFQAFNLKKSFTDGGTLVAESINCISFIPAGFRGGPTPNTMNPVREDIGGSSALMSLVHVITIPKDIRIYNATTLRKEHKPLLNEMKDLGEKAVEILLNGPKEMMGSLKWVYNQSGEIEMTDGTKKSLVVTMDDLSHDSQMNFSKTPSRSPIRNSFHVYPAASIGWIHLHSYLGDFLTSAHDTMERQAISAGYKKNTTFEEVVSVL